ncbi:MAG: flagellar hook-basal body complex protein FliE [bacterium]|nr:flagellar hook-basal body complex protein FliE [bacterium]
MPDPIDRISPLRPQRPELDPAELRKPQLGTPAPSQSFGDVLKDAVTEVNRLQDDADTAVKDLVSGKVKDVTDAMVAVEKADIAFQTMMTVRNKMVAAYEEIMRMNV